MRKASVIVASTRAAVGDYVDTSGACAVEFLRSRGFDTPDAVIVPDAGVAQAVHEALAAQPAVLLTSGGTGITPDDLTVEIVEPLLDKQLPGIVHAFWAKGFQNTPTAVLSRAVAGIAGRTFVMTLPGSRGGVKDGCAVLDPLLDHILNLVEGTRDH